jgi:alpha-tubulin suppressor-like RCC1 family protein
VVGVRVLGRLGVALLVCAGLLSLGSCVADAPPVMGAVVAGEGEVTVSWEPPIGDVGRSLTGYVVTPYIDGVAQTPVRFDSTATTQTLFGLVNATTYTFTVHGINALGSDTATSASSDPVTPTAPPIAVGDGAPNCSIATGALVCWSGDGSVPAATVLGASPATTVDDATSVDAGYQHVCAVNARDWLPSVPENVFCVGEGTFGLLGNGSFSDCAPAGCYQPYTSPVSGVKAIAVSAGNGHTCALEAAGSVMCWGLNEFGQLGRSGPGSGLAERVAGITDATGISAGDGHTCARLSNGTVKCWGYNYWGQLGNGQSGPAYDVNRVPTLVSGLTDAVAVSAGGDITCARLASGGVKCWGHNSAGSLGNGTTTHSPIPVTVIGIADATSVTAGVLHACARLANGTVKCWGWDYAGELGDGGPIGLTYSSTPVTVAGITDAAYTAAGRRRTCAVETDETDETVKCWGMGTGPGNTNSSSPVTVVGL